MGGASVSLYVFCVFCSFSGPIILTEIKGIYDEDDDDDDDDDYDKDELN